MNFAHGAASPKAPSTLSYPRGGRPAAAARRNSSNLGRLAPSSAPPTDHTSENRKMFSTHSGRSFLTDSQYSCSASASASDCSPPPAFGRRSIVSESKSDMTPRTRVISSVAWIPTETVALHSLIVNRTHGGTSQPKRFFNLSACGASGGGSVSSHDARRGSHPS